jgi:catechol-2,3-dioxygenase
MKVQHRFPTGAWLTNDEANHRLALLTLPQLSDDPDKLRHTGIHHLAFEHSSMNDLLDSYIRLKEEGILPHACLDHGMTISIYYVDPDGNSVELQADNFGDWNRSSEWMCTSPEFAQDPIGRNFDPDRLVAARAAGASPEEIHRRTYAGEFDPGTALDLRLPM